MATVEQLRAYTYSGPHAEILRQRRDWFEKFERVAVALWWVPAGHVPTMDEAKQRLASLDEHGPTPFAFTFKTLFPPDDLKMAHPASPAVDLTGKSSGEVLEAFPGNGWGGPHRC